MNLCTSPRPKALAVMNITITNSNPNPITNNKHFTLNLSTFKLHMLVIPKMLSTQYTQKNVTEWSTYHWWRLHQRYGALVDTKCVCFFNGQEQLLVQDFGRRVRGQVQSVEAGVRARQAVRLAPLLDAELARPRRAAQRCEALVRDAWRARYELQESKALLVWESIEKNSHN